MSALSVSVSAKKTMLLVGYVIRILVYPVVTRWPSNVKQSASRRGELLVLVKK